MDIGKEINKLFTYVKQILNLTLLGNYYYFKIKNESVGVQYVLVVPHLP